MYEVIRSQFKMIFVDDKMPSTIKVPSKGPRMVICHNKAALISSITTPYVSNSDCTDASKYSSIVFRIQ